MRRLSAILAVLFLAGNSSAQELFINSEPASNMPLHSYGFRLSSESFSQSNIFHDRTDLELMYEFTPQLMAHGMIHASNYYGNYQYNSFGVYGKYRIYTDDGFKTHFRIAAYAEGAFGPTRNTFADAMLDGGNSGMNAGLVFTLLQHRFALSSTLGAIVFVPDEAIYKNIKNYLFSLSAGYLISPKEYQSYSDLNINIYAELLGKYVTYFSPEISVVPGLPQYYLNKGILLDLAIGPQVIINSISRVDLAVRTRLIHGVESFPTPAFLIRYEQMFYH